MIIYFYLQYGLFDYPGDDLDSQDISDGGDSDLEAELAAISGGGAPKTKRKKPAAAPLVNIDSLVAESLRDIPTDEEISGKINENLVDV